MADVFAVAIFLYYLSFSNMNSGINTEVNTLVELYIFIAYCVLSIASSKVPITSTRPISLALLPPMIRPSAKGTIFDCIFPLSALED